MMFSAYKVWILLVTNLLAATEHFKYLLRGKITFGSAVTVNVCLFQDTEMKPKESPQGPSAVRRRQWWKKAAGSSSMEQTS